MLPLLQRASDLLESALAVAGAGEAVTTTAVLIDERGAIQLVCDSDWSLEQLRRERGATEAFQITGRGARVSVEARTTTTHCRLERELPVRALLQPVALPVFAGPTPLLSAAR